MKTLLDEAVKKKMTVAEAMSMTEAGAVVLWLEMGRDQSYRNRVLAELFEQNPCMFSPANSLPC